MLEIIVKGRMLYVFMGIFAVIGIMSKGIVNLTLKRLVHAAGNMNKSNHPLMRLVKAKFEHACMVSDTVENVAVFVDKYLYEYRVLGMKLHTWQRMEKMAAGACIMLGVAGAGLCYVRDGMNDEVLRLGTAGAALGIFVYLVHLTTDENYRMEAMKNYMIDYLENVCRRRYEKANQKEIQVMAPETVAKEAIPVQETPTVLHKETVVEMPVRETAAEPVKEPRAEMQSAAAAEEKPEKEKTIPDRDVRIRQILEEFMA